MKHIFLFFVIVINLSFMPTTKTIYDFKATSIDGSEVDMNSFKGKKLLIVNVASECGFTPQYETLQEVYDEYGGDNFEIIGFPSNQFGGQEPGSDDEIMTFCKKNYGVTFTMMSKIKVKGKEIHPIYQWLTSKSENGVEDAEVKWNFHKFLVNADGTWAASVPTKESPACDQIIDWLEDK